MDKKSAEDFINRNRHCDHGHVIWTDGKENEFGITLRTEDLMKYPSVYEHIAAKALGWYPERKKERRNQKPTDCRIRINISIKTNMEVQLQWKVK